MTTLRLKLNLYTKAITFPESQLDFGTCLRLDMWDASDRSKQAGGLGEEGGGGCDRDKDRHHFIYHSAFTRDMYTSYTGPFRGLEGHARGIISNPAGRGADSEQQQWRRQLYAEAVTGPGPQQNK